MDSFTSFTHHFSEFGTYIFDSVKSMRYPERKDDPSFRDALERNANLAKFIPLCWSNERSVVETRIEDNRRLGERYNDCCIKGDAKPLYTSCAMMRNEFFTALADTESYIRGSIIMSSTRDPENMTKK